MSCRVKASPTDVLGLADDADSDEIRAAYRRLSRSVHPDKGGSTVLFQLINEAYEILTTGRSGHRGTGPHTPSRSAPTVPRQSVPRPTGQRTPRQPRPRNAAPAAAPRRAGRPVTRPVTRPAPQAGTRPGPEWRVPSQPSCPSPKINHSWPGVRRSSEEPAGRPSSPPESSRSCSPVRFRRIDHTWPGIRVAHMRSDC